MTMSKDEHRRAMMNLCIAHVTSPAENRMRARTAKEQHAAMLEALRGPDEIPPSDADDESMTRKGVLS
jgi:hypothetical protein